MGDFNVHLLYYKIYSHSREFLDKLFSASLSPHITMTTRVTPRSKTLSENIFTSGLDDNLYVEVFHVLSMFRSSSTISNIH